MKNKGDIPKTKVTALELSEKEDLVFSIAHPAYGTFIDIRKYVDLDGNGKKIPTKQGWFIPASFSEELLKAVTELAEMIAEEAEQVEE